MSIHSVINIICILIFVFASCVLTMTFVKMKSIKMMERMIEDINRLGGYSFVQTDDGNFEKRDLTSSDLKEGIIQVIQFYMSRL